MMVCDKCGYSGSSKHYRSMAGGKVLCSDCKANEDKEEDEKGQKQKKGKG